MVGGFDIMKLIKEAGKIQEKVDSQQQQLGSRHFEAEAGGGMVRVVVNGLLNVVSIHVEPDTIKTLGETAFLELVTGALNEALKQAREGVKGDMLSLFQEMAGDVIGSEES